MYVFFFLAKFPPVLPLLVFNTQLNYFYVFNSFHVTQLTVVE